MDASALGLDDQSQTPAHDAVAVLPANNKGSVGTSTQGTRNSVQVYAMCCCRYLRSDVCMRDTPSSADYKADG
jgi:hypothetical protein